MCVRVRYSLFIISELFACFFFFVTLFRKIIVKGILWGAKKLFSVQ